jgi:uncharacterized protein
VTHLTYLHGVYTVSNVKYEWDDEKNRRNIRKHGIDFLDVPAMFQNPMVVFLDDRKDYGEDRWIGIGHLKSVLAVIVFTEPEDDTIRILSARKAMRHEEEIYRTEV